MSYVHHNDPVVEREKINLYFDANDNRVYTKGIVLFVVCYFSLSGREVFFLILASNKFNILHISHADFRIYFAANGHN